MELGAIAFEFNLRAIAIRFNLEAIGFLAWIERDVPDTEAVEIVH